MATTYTIHLTPNPSHLEEFRARVRKINRGNPSRLVLVEILEDGQWLFESEWKEMVIMFEFKDLIGRGWVY